MKRETNFINSKDAASQNLRLHEDLVANFKAWIHFNDGECITFTAYSVVTSTKRYLTGYRTIGVDYEKGMNGLLRMIEVTYKGKYKEARIYTKHRIKEKDNKLVARWVKGELKEHNPIRYDFCQVFYNRADFDTYNSPDFITLNQVSI